MPPEAPNFSSAALCATFGDLVVQRPIPIRGSAAAGDRAPGQVIAGKYRLMQKLGVSTNTELLRYAIQHRLTEDPAGGT